MPLDTQQLLQLGIPLAVALLGLLVGFVVRRTLIARLARAAKDTRSTVDDVIVSAVHGEFSDEFRKAMPRSTSRG